MIGVWRLMVGSCETRKGKWLMVGVCFFVEGGGGKVKVWVKIKGLENG